MVRVLFFSKGDERVASSRFRCFYFADALRDEGFDVRICQPPPRHLGLRSPLAAVRELGRLGRVLATVERGEIIYLQRPIKNDLFVALLVLDKLVRRRKLVFDFCDPIFLHSPRKTRVLTRLADAVVVSCADLGDYARRYNPRVFEIPNSLPEEQIRRRARQRRPDGRTIVGWVGYALGHEENIRMLLPVLSGLPSGVTIRMIGMRGADRLSADLRALPGAAVELVDWVSPDRVADEVAAFDVCLLPLQDTPWNRKLNTKLVEYMALGRAVVASPVGENRRIVRDGENGFLASGQGEWRRKLELLLADPALRRRLGDEARRTIAERFALGGAGRRLAELLRTVGAEA